MPGTLLSGITLQSVAVIIVPVSTAKNAQKVQVYAIGCESVIWALPSHVGYSFSCVGLVLPDWFGHHLFPGY